MPSPSPFINSLPDYSCLDLSLHFNNTTLQFIAIIQLNTIPNSISLVFFPETQYHHHYVERIEIMGCLLCSILLQHLKATSLRLVLLVFGNEQLC